MDAAKLTTSTQDPTSLDTYLDHLSALRVSYLNLPTEKEAAILRALPREYMVLANHFAYAISLGTEEAR